MSAYLCFKYCVSEADVETEAEYKTGWAGSGQSRGRGSLRAI